MTRFVLLAVLLLVVVWAFSRLLDGIIAAFGGLPQRSRSKTPVKLVRDPVCGTYVAPKPELSLVAGKTTHYFCSDKCRREFRS